MPRKQLVLLVIFAGALMAILGCANPADNKPEAEVSEPTPTPTQVEEPAAGERFVLSEGTTIGFTGSKVTGSHEGGFTAFEGEINLVGKDPLASSVKIAIDTTSLWADDDNLTGHLKSPDFFDVEKFSVATFESTAIAKTDEGYSVTGNLDLHGVQKGITFPAAITIEDGQVSAKAEFVIQRFDFEILYKGKADNLIRDEVVIRFDLVGTPAS